MSPVGIGFSDKDEATVESPLEVLLTQIVKKTKDESVTPGPSEVKIKQSTSSIKKE